ncbi:MAG: hypothetical protein IPK97_17195 [Ahniella sp.]|nr:hypothetical protein [Ahniella sp.]
MLPEREKVNRATHREKWWIYGDKRPALYHALGWGEMFERHPKGDWPSERSREVLVATRTTKHLALVFVENNSILDQGLVVLV